MNYDANGYLYVNVASGGGGGGGGTGSTSLISNGSTVGPSNPLPTQTYTNGAATTTSNPFPTIGPLPAPLAGQKVIATTGTAVSLGTGALQNGVVVKARATNAAPIFIGPVGVTTTDTGSGSGYRLSPGESISYAVSNLNTLYINGTANDFVYYAGN